MIARNVRDENSKIYKFIQNMIQSQESVHKLVEKANEMLTVDSLFTTEVEGTIDVKKLVETALVTYFMIRNGLVNCTQVSATEFSFDMYAYLKSLEMSVNSSNDSTVTYVLVNAMLEHQHIFSIGAGIEAIHKKWDMTGIDYDSLKSIVPRYWIAIQETVNWIDNFSAIEIDPTQAIAYPLQSYSDLYDDPSVLVGNNFCLILNDDKISEHHIYEMVMSVVCDTQNRYNIQKVSFICLKYNRIITYDISVVFKNVTKIRKNFINYTNGTGQSYFS